MSGHPLAADLWPTQILFLCVYVFLYRHVGCGCNVAKLILKSFGPVIKTNLAAPPQGGRDIQRDQRSVRHNNIDGGGGPSLFVTQNFPFPDMRSVSHAMPT